MCECNVLVHQTVRDDIPGSSVRRRNQSHPLARDDDAVDNDRHGEQSKTEIYIRRKPFVPELPHGPCHSV